MRDAEFRHIFLENWRENRRFLTELPVNYPRSPAGDRLRRFIKAARKHPNTIKLRRLLKKRIKNMYLGKRIMGVATDVAGTPQELWYFIAAHTGLLMNMFYDICPLVELYDP